MWAGPLGCICRVARLRARKPLGGGLGDLLGASWGSSWGPLGGLFVFFRCATTFAHYFAVVGCAGHRLDGASSELRM